MVQDRVSEPFRDLGSQRVKNISRAIRVWQWTPDAPAEDVDVAAAAHSQRLQFCTADDGVQIAYARVGAGAPIFKAPNWFGHIEYEWRSPVWGPAFAALAEHHELVRFDQRGSGLSDWDAGDISLDAMIGDMATVAAAAGLEEFPLLGISQGCAFSIRYAAEHPGQVRCLILFGGFARGRLRRGSPEEEQMHEIGRTMIRQGWGSPNPAYRHFFTSNFIPDATTEQAANFDEMQRISSTAENAERIWDMNGSIDVTELAKQVTAPTLVLHCQGDRVAPLEEGRRIAALIPNARLVPLAGDNHIALQGTPAFDAFNDEVRAFLRENGC